MTSVAMHATPGRRVVAAAQVRTVRRSLRPETQVLIALALLTVVMTVYAAIRALGHPHVHVQIGYMAQALIPMMAIAFFLPVSVWRGEGRARRAYHWSMPVDFREHTLAKVYGGWVYLMTTSVIYVLLIHLLGLLAALVTHDWPSYSAGWWEYAVAFTGPTILYLIVSVFVVGSRAPGLWALAIGAVWLIGKLFASIGFELIDKVFRAILIGTYGSGAAVIGPVGHHVFDFGDLVSWLIATVLWLGGALALLALVSGRHPEK